MYDLTKDLPLVADLDVEGQQISWTEPDGTPVLVLNGALPARAVGSRTICRQIRRTDTSIEH